MKTFLIMSALALGFLLAGIVSFAELPTIAARAGLHS